jgi:Undecaprenyl-phosphate glucose phosphotransferase
MLRRLQLYRFQLRLVCYFLPFLAFQLADLAYLILNKGSITFTQHSGNYYQFLLSLTVVWAVAAEKYGVCSIEKLFIENTGIRAATAAIAASYSIVLVTLYFYREVYFSRLFVALSAPALLFLALLMRGLFRHRVRAQVNTTTPSRILVVGADRFARRTAQRLLRTPLASCKVVGFVRLPCQDVAVDDVPVYELQDFENLELGHGIEDVVIAIPPSQFSEIPNITTKLEKLCLPVRVVVDWGEGIVIRERLFQFGRLQLLDLQRTPAESVQYLLYKRAFDVVFSLLVLVATAPLLALIAIAVKLSSPGPVFFTQERVGNNRGLFKMYKFRTMKVAPSSDSDVLWTTPNDQRKTLIGAFLRKTSLDELPQFFNVLKGDMSVVGPRPERPFYVNKFVNDFAQYHDRHRLKVGITGWAQVNGWRGDTSIQKRLEHDLYYLQNWSMGLDMRIILKTVTSSFGKNAY